MTYSEIKRTIESFTELGDFRAVSQWVGSDWRAAGSGFSLEAFRRDALAALDRKFPTPESREG